MLSRQTHADCFRGRLTVLESLIKRGCNCTEESWEIKISFEMRLGVVY